MKHLFKQALFLLLLTWTSMGSAYEFLTVDKAFQIAVSVENGRINAHWTVTPEHYLYEHTLAIELDGAPDIQLGTPQILPVGKQKNDEFMGDVIIHDKDTTLSIPYQSTKTQQAQVIVKYQGCAEAGLCYPPKKYRTSLELPSQPQALSQATPAAAQNAAKSVSVDTPASETLVSETPGSKDKAISERSLAKNMLIFFGLGLLLSLTPCVLPMVPILSSIILGSDQSKLSAKRGFALSSSYVLGMATIYTFAGLLVALSGARLQIYLQHPYVLWTLAGIFSILSVSLFGAFELRLPSGFHNKLAAIQSKIPGGQYSSVFLIGAFSAVVVSPCVSAPLAGILLYVAQDGDALTGGLSLFALAMGMGAPLIVLGTTGSNALPKAGLWMEAVKTFFGFMMLAMAIYIVKHLIETHLLYLMISLLLAFFGVWIGALHQTTFASRLHHSLGKAFGIICLIFATIFAYQSSQLIFPTQSVLSSTKTTKVEMNRVVTLDELNAELAKAKAAGKPAMIDVYADWCVACIEFEVKTFPVAEVRQSLEKMHLIKLDITEDIDTQAILDALNVIGPPTLIFYDSKGEELKDLRVTGYMDAEAFAPVAKAVSQR